MSRTRIVGGNWKLHLSPEESSALGEALVPALAGRGDTQVVVFPTAISITETLRALAGSGIAVGVQDVHTGTAGAFTGANSAVLARKAGVTHALVGHSERRHVFGDSLETVHQKLVTCLDAGLQVTLCIGETLDDRDAGNTLAVLQEQLATALNEVPADRVSTMVIAYEPVWAIGTGRTASPEQAQQAHAGVRQWLADAYATWLADEMRIQYGGSVKPHNAAELMACPDIDGALVGGASLKAESFAGIVLA